MLVVYILITLIIGYQSDKFDSYRDVRVDIFT